VTGSLVLLAGVYVYLSSGNAPVSAADPSLPLEELVINTALRRQPAASRDVQPPIPVSDEHLQAGAKVYIQQCAVCHGTPKQPVSKVASGMYPPPPQLFHGEGVTRSPVGETYWKIAQGVRLSGMPAFRRSLSDAEMWEVTLLVANAQNLPSTVAGALDERPVPSSPPRVLRRSPQ
jgi:mono/diheme cytochrome c family protein